MITGSIPVLSPQAHWRIDQFAFPALLATAALMSRRAPHPRRFVQPHAVEVGGKHPSGAGVTIATGTRPVVPDIDCLDRLPYFTGDLPTVDEASEPTC